MKQSSNDILIYQAEDGSAVTEVRLDADTLWLTQAQIAELFQVKPQNITMHLKKIFQQGELDEEATCKDFLQVQNESGRNVKRNRKFYNLDAVISVGTATPWRRYSLRQLYSVPSDTPVSRLNRATDTAFGGIIFCTVCSLNSFSYLGISSSPFRPT